MRDLERCLSSIRRARTREAPRQGRRLGGILTGAAALLVVLALAGVALAGVVVYYSYTVASTPASPVFYLQDGPNYASANAMGLFTATMTGSPSNVVAGTTIDVNTVAGSSDTYLLNVLDVYNSSSITAHAYLWINGTLPTGVSMYYSTTPIHLTGSPTPPTVSGTLWVTGAQIPLSTAGPAVVEEYFAFALTGAAMGPGTLSFQYQVT